MDLRYQLSQAALKKQEAERELRELNAKTSRRMEKAAQVCADVLISLDLFDICLSRLLTQYFVELIVS